MILQALVRHYKDLEAKGEIAPLGWAPSDISFAICLGDNGQVEQIISIKTMQTSGKKSVLRPQRILLPLVAEGRTSTAVRPNFIWDNAGYLLGLNTKGDTARGINCFLACKSFHNTLLSGCSSPAAKALLAFFERWEPEKAAGHPAVVPIFDQLMKGGNLVFRYHGAYLHKDDQIKSAWNSYYASAKAGEEEMVCLVTGERQAVARIHPKIKGVLGGEAMGNSLVCFNDVADESYGCFKSQGRNAPTSKYAAFAYTTALNHLLADREHVLSVGDTTVVCWAEGGQSAYQDIFAGFFDDRIPRYTERELREKVKALLSVSQVNIDSELDPGRPFYILGLAPNAARLSVRFFLQSTFGQMLANVQAHYDRLEIVKPANVANGALPLWRLLGETVNPNSRDKKASPPMAGAVVRAILSGGPYPVSLLEQTMLRIRAEQNVTYGRAAILKAVFLKNREFNVPEEVLQVELNDQSNHLPYVLGRLFAVLERVQSAANPGLNATIKDKYFNSACATPATIFPLLTKLSQSHLRKLEGGRKTYFEKLIGELEGRIHETLPVRLSLADQGTFHLGYYHQVQKFYEKKDKGGNENV